MARKLTNLLAYLDERLGKHSGRGPEYHFYCPACVDRTGDESGKRKLGVNVAKGVGGCFRCGFAFRSFGQLFRYLNGGFLRAEEFSLLRNEVALPKSMSLRSAVRDRMIPKKTLGLRPLPLPPEYVRLSDLSAADRRASRYRLPFTYLAERGVLDPVVEDWQIGYCATGEYSQRLIFPVVQGERVVYWTNRYCGQHPLKSKNPPNLEGYHQRGTCLLGYDRCFAMPRVALAEGPFSALAFEGRVHTDRRDLLTPAVAMMGKFLSDEQVRLVGELVRHGLMEIVLALDPGAGQEVDEIRSALLPVVPRVSVLVLEGGDPDDLREELPQLLEGRRSPSVADRVRQRLNG